MHEILFRGKRKDNGEWVYGDLSQHKNGKKFIKCGSATQSYDVIPETVGQYTGIEANGKKIFEGDIVKADDYIFVVKFGKCGGVANAENCGYIGFYFGAFSESTKLSAKYGLRDDICYFTDIEVISNIHDNPELLEGVEQK